MDSLLKGPVIWRMYGKLPSSWNLRTCDSLCRKSPVNQLLINQLGSWHRRNINGPHYSPFVKGNLPVTDEFPSQRDSNVESVSLSWRQHAVGFTEQLGAAANFDDLVKFGNRRQIGRSQMFIKLAFEFGCDFILMSHPITQSLSTTNIDFRHEVLIFHKPNWCSLIDNYFRHKTPCGIRKLTAAFLS